GHIASFAASRHPQAPHVAVVLQNLLHGPGAARRGDLVALAGLGHIEHAHADGGDAHGHLVFVHDLAAMVYNAGDVGVRLRARVVGQVAGGRKDARLVSEHFVIKDAHDLAFLPLAALGAPSAGGSSGLPASGSGSCWAPAAPAEPITPSASRRSSSARSVGWYASPWRNTSPDLC